MITKPQYEWITSLRAFACMAVVLLHVVAGWEIEDFSGGGGLTSWRWILDCVIIQVLVRWAVPVFVMISGFLLLDPNRDISLCKLRGYILRMLLVLSTFGLAYCIIETVMVRGLSNIPVSLFISVKNLIEGKSWAHMWYVYMLIGLYVLTPVLRAFAKNSSQKEMAAVLIALFVLTIVRPTINQLFGMEIEGFVSLSSPYVFYYLMGCYVHRYGLGKRLSWSGMIIGALGIIIVELGEKVGILIGSFPDNVFVAIYSIGIFSLASNCRTLEKQANFKLSLSISQFSFGIYLIHPFFLNLLNKGFDIFPGSLPTGIGELTFFVYAFVGAYIATWGLSYFKLFRKLLK